LDSSVKVRRQRIAPVEAPECLRVKVGYIKVRLSYLTFDPKHMRSQMLRNSCGARPPYAEDICVLIPRMKVFPTLSTYNPAFKRLQDCNLLTQTAKLTGFTIVDEDDSTLAYVV
jgi:hypothetical protein